jgi:hypothetical protein
MLIVKNIPFMLNAVMLSVVMPSDIMLNVIIQNVYTKMSLC